MAGALACRSPGLTICDSETLDRDVPCQTARGRVGHASGWAVPDRDGPAQPPDPSLLLARLGRPNLSLLLAAWPALPPTPHFYWADPLLPLANPSSIFATLSLLSISQPLTFVGVQLANRLTLLARPLPSISQIPVFCHPGFRRRFFSTKLTAKDLRSPVATIWLAAGVVFFSVKMASQDLTSPVAANHLAAGAFF